MTESGTKLVLALLGLALALGAVSWWYRFESAHRATEFWGPVAAELIEEPSEVTGYQLGPAPAEQQADSETLALANQTYSVPLQKPLTDAPGMVHLRHALMTDSDYLWMQRPEAPDKWRWALKFSHGDRYVLVLFTEDLTTLGKATDASAVAPISCQPMAESLREYFAALGLQ